MCGYNNLCYAKKNFKQNNFEVLETQILYPNTNLDFD